MMKNEVNRALCRAKTKLFFKLSMLLFGLFAGVGTMRAGIEQIVGSLDVENPATWFYVNLNAQVSNPGCGTTNPGQVWLLHTQAEPTDKLADEADTDSWICLQDENGDPILDPAISNAAEHPWTSCLHLQHRKAVNPWITNNPKPVEPENPYTIEYVNELYNLWNTAFNSGTNDKANSNSKNYPNDNGWSDEQRAASNAGYDFGYNGSGAWYDNPYGNKEQVIGYWDDDRIGGFSTGVADAKAGKTKKTFEGTSIDPASGDYWGVACEWPMKKGYNAGYDWYHDWYTVGHYLNAAEPVGAAKPTGFAPSVSLKGTALVYAPGFEDADLSIAYVSTYAYFYGKVQENDGWYFTGWSYTEGESDLGGVVAGSAENDSIELRVLPASTAGESNIRNAYVYATFRPVLVANYKVGGMMNVGKEATNYGETTVVFEAAGERVDAADFTASVEEANFTATITACTDNNVTVTVRFTNPDGNIAENVYRGNVKLASKSGCSELTAAVYARVGGASENDATLYDGKTPTETSGTLEAMIAAANGTDKIVVLNRDYTSALNINAGVTIDLNGYNINALTVSGGEVTIAYNKYGGRGTAVSVTGGKLILNGAEFASLNISNGATVEQNGALITGVVTNNGTLITTEGHVEGGLISAGVLTINGGTFEGTTAIAITGGTASINKATISGTTYGIQASNNSTAEITSKLVSVYGGTNAVNGKVTLTNGKFDGATPLTGSVTLNGGYFKVDGAHLGIEVPEGKKVLNVLAGIEFAEGYRYFVGDDASTVGVCRIGTTSYETLEKALAYANNNTDKNVTIIMTNDYVLPAGYYTLPSKATLIVPMSNEQENGYEIINRVSSNSASRVDYEKPYEFRRLTFAQGVNMDVHGTIELTGTQRAADDAYASMPHGSYGHLIMEEGSHMTLQKGSLLRAWGYMTGKGETDARRGSTVREQFQMGDWKGGLNSFNMLNLSLNPGRVFPISQYFIQNIESPVKYHPGATLSTTTSVSAAQGGIGITAMANDIIVVGVSGGDPAMFFMDQEADAENTWVRKWYDAEHDIQTYDVNSGAHIGSMVLDLGKLGTDPLKMNSGMFVLPITNNMKIHLLSGSMDFTQVTALLPGAEVEVDKESVVTIYINPDESVFSGALVLYDSEQWGAYACGKLNNGMETGKYTKVVKYSPSWDGALVADKPVDGKPTVRHEDVCPADASINVHGTFATGDGYLLTTEGGANIFSSNEDAGSYVCSQNPPTEQELAELYVFPINKNAAAKKLYLAKLKNADQSYTETENAIAGFAYLYRDDKWQEPMTQTANDMIVTYNSNCFAADVSMMTYLNLVCIVTDYSSQQAMLASPMKEDVKNQVAIVHAPDNIAEFLAAKPLAAQLAPGEEMTAQGYEWMKHSDEIYQGNVTYKQAFAMYKDQIQRSANAIKEAGYDFGSAVQKLYIKPQEWLEIAGTAHVQLGIDDVSYYEDLYDEGISEGLSNGDYSQCTQAVSEYLDYIESQRMNPVIVSVDGNADHTYSDAAGAGRLFILMEDNCQWWEVEKKNNLYHCIHPQNDTYYYWGVDPVDGEEKWLEKKFTITWKNWNGTIIQTADKDGNPQDAYEVAYGTMAEFLGTNPTREKTIDYTYDFTGWTPALGRVTSDVTYTATYTEKPRMYTIIFQQEGGVEIERHFLTHNEVPVCENVPTKVGHTLKWSPAIAAVTGDATYTATWLENPPTEYEVTFYDYDGTTVLKQGYVAVGETPTAPAIVNGKPQKADESFGGKPATNEFTYVFDHWSPALEEVSATSIKAYTAVYAEVAKTYTIIFLDENGDEIERHQYQYGETPVCSEVPTKAADAQYTYTLRWTPQIQTVMEAATYRVVFDETLNKYTVSVMSNPSGACAISGAGIYDYNASENAVTITITPNPGYTFAGWSDDPENTNTTRQMAITDDINLVANFTVAEPDYTITWKNEAGTANLVDPVGQKSGTATIYTGEIPTKPASTQYVYTFDGWTTEANGAGTFYKNNMTPKATANATYYAHFKESQVIMEIGLGQAQNIAEATTVNQLIINSNGTVSGQLTGAALLTVTGACYYDLTGTFTAGKWFAVAVPWQVTASDIKADGNALSWNSGNYLAYYDGSVRAAQGKVDACWKYVKNSDVLIPGRLYMLYLENSASVLRFPKKAGAPILSTTTGISAFGSGIATDANWNGIANPAIYYAYLSNTGATVGQIFNAASQSYEAVSLSNKLIVAKPIFVQATNNGSATAVTTPPASAPARRNATAEALKAEYQIEIASYGRMQDRLFIQTNEDKEADIYTLGQDVMKFGVSDKVAQMWVDRYDTKLCMNTMAPVNNAAEFPLSLFAPRAGEYTIAIEKEQATDDHSLYLTYNGEAIWNLSEGAYTMNLEKGTDAHYGLRVSIKKAPEVVTGIDEAIVDSKDATATKVLLHGQVFIIRGERVYSIDGQLVK